MCSAVTAFAPGTTGGTSVLTCAGVIIAVIYGAANVPPLVFGRPEFLIAFNATLMVAAAVLWFATGSSAGDGSGDGDDGTA